MSGIVKWVIEVWHNGAILIDVKTKFFIITMAEITYKTYFSFQLGG